MLLEIHERNPQGRLIAQAAEILRKDGVIIFPTDTVYALGCSITSRNAVEKIYRLKSMERNKPLSMILSDISQMNQYVKNMSDQSYKLMRKFLPGPYTFIFNAAKKAPRYMLAEQKTVGVRIPDHIIAQELVRELGDPLLVTSVHAEEGEYVVDPEELRQTLGKQVDCIISTGATLFEESTIVDCCTGIPEVIRRGKGYDEIETYIV